MTDYRLPTPPETIEYAVRCGVLGCNNGWIHSSKWWESGNRQPEGECKVCNGTGMRMRRMSARFEYGIENVELPKETS